MTEQELNRLQHDHSLEILLDCIANTAKRMREYADELDRTRSQIAAEPGPNSVYRNRSSQVSNAVNTIENMMRNLDIARIVSSAIAFGIAEYELNRD